MIFSFGFVLKWGPSKFNKLASFNTSLLCSSSYDGLFDEPTIDSKTSI